MEAWTEALEGDRDRDREQLASNVYRSMLRLPCAIGMRTPCVLQDCGIAIVRPFCSRGSRGMEGRVRGRETGKAEERGKAATQLDGLDGLEGLDGLDELLGWTQPGSMNGWNPSSKQET